MDSMERLGKTIFYIIFAAIPAVLWYASSGFDATSFSSGYQMVSIIAKMAAIVGICFFSGNLILSGRYKIVDRLFGGLDRVYLFHRRTGITTFILLSTHVVLISARTLFESYDAFIAFVTNITYLPINFGRFAYGGLFVIIVITLWFGRKIKYERLKFIHSFMGVFLFFGGLHAFFIPSDIATNLPLRWYVLGLASLGIISWLVRTVFKRWLVRRHILDVIQVNPLPGIVTEVIMKPRNEKIRFLPGQFIFVRFRQKGFPYEDHPFSLTASPEEGRLRISAKAIGDFTTKLKELKPGAEAHVQGPFGGFSFLRFKNKKQIWIAGGIGITGGGSLNDSVVLVWLDIYEIIKIRSGILISHSSIR